MYHISVYMIIISVHVSDDYILFAQAPLMFMFYSTKTRRLLNLRKIVAYCRLSTIKRQHHVAVMAYPAR